AVRERLDVAALAPDRLEREQVLERPLRDQALFDEDPAERLGAAGQRLELEAALQVPLGHHAVLEQECPEPRVLDRSAHTTGPDRPAEPRALNRAGGPPAPALSRRAPPRARSTTTRRRGASGSARSRSRRRRDAGTRCAPRARSPSPRAASRRRRPRRRAVRA